MHYFVGLLFFYVVQVIKSDDPVLETHIGKFRGKTFEFSSGVKVDAFYGVPYAKPPVANLRFEKPQDAEFQTERDALYHPNACWQPDYTNKLKMDEDCLYLNVFRPHKVPPQNQTGYPTLFFIHGGAFQMGSAEDHTTDYAAEHYAAKGLVYVVPQYRLNIFGPEQFAGNYGLWDLRRALLFIRKNAKGFYVDPKRITVGGYSAGSAAASALTLSEHTRDLFQQALQLSGSTFAEWAVSNRAVLQTEKVVGILKCEDQSSAAVKKCLKNKSVRDLQVAMHDAVGEINYFDYTPRIDADFFTSDLPELVATGPPKATLTTITQNEAIYFSHATEIHPHALTQEQKDKFQASDFRKFVRKTIAPEKAFGDKAREVQDKIIDFYLRLREPEKHDRYFYLDVYAKVLGDILFVVPQLLELRHKTASGWPVYAIKNIHNEFIERELAHLEVRKTTHAYEYSYLFGKGFLGKHEFTKDDLKFRNLLVDAIVNFVKTRSPKSPSNPNFKHADNVHPFIYTELSTEAVLKEHLFADEFRFWSSITKDYDFNIIRGIHKKTLRLRSEL